MWPLHAHSARKARRRLREPTSPSGHNFFLFFAQMPFSVVVCHDHGGLMHNWSVNGGILFAAKMPVYKHY